MEVAVAVRHGSCDVVSILIKDKLTVISEQVVKATGDTLGKASTLRPLVLTQFVVASERCAESQSWTSIRP